MTAAELYRETIRLDYAIQASSDPAALIAERTEVWQTLTDWLAQQASWTYRRGADPDADATLEADHVG